MSRAIVVFCDIMVVLIIVVLITVVLIIDIASGPLSRESE